MSVRFSIKQPADDRQRNARVNREPRSRRGIAPHNIKNSQTDLWKTDALHAK
jgi:hypothetical protein